MAPRKNKHEIRFELNDEDYAAFGRYRILYTKGGRSIVWRQRITYLISGVMIALLFTIFHVGRSFTILAYAVAAGLGIGGFLFAQRIVLRQQDRAIKAEQDSVDRVHPVENIVTFNEDSFETKAGDDVQVFAYKDIKLLDLAETAIYVWMSDTMIMPLPLHAFNEMDDMKETYKWMKQKVKEQGGGTERNGKK